MKGIPLPQRAAAETTGAAPRRTRGRQLKLSWPLTSHPRSLRPLGNWVSSTVGAPGSPRIRARAERRERGPARSPGEQRSRTSCPRARRDTPCQQCHGLRVTPSRASSPLTPRPQEPGLPPRPFSCRLAKRERAGPPYLGGGPQRRPGLVAPKGGGGPQTAVEHGGRHF